MATKKFICIDKFQNTLNMSNMQSSSVEIHLQISAISINEISSTNTRIYASKFLNTYLHACAMTSSAQICIWNFDTLKVTVRLCTNVVKMHMPVVFS